MVIGSRQTNAYSFLHDLGASLFVWMTWTIMVIAALVFVKQYGSNVPSWDGWDMVPTLTGEQPVTGSWLWSQHNEHRIPLPRLILLGLHRITGINFFTPMVFNVLVHAGLAFWMILVSRRLRGEISYTDAFFPLLFLHWGHAANFLWGWQVQFISSVALAIIVLLLIAQSDVRPTLRTASWTGICLLLLPLTGANGLALVPALGLWLGYLAILIWRSGDLHARRNSFLTVCFGLSALLLVGLYLIGYEHVPGHPASSGFLSTLSTCAKLLTIGFGPALQGLWPFSVLGVFLLLLITVTVLVVRLRDQPQGRHRTVGFICFFGALASLASAIGLGRNGFEPRYVILFAPVWCGVYFVWNIYGAPKVNFLVRMSLFLLTGLTLWSNTQLGVEYAKTLRQQLVSFEHDMVAGVPSPTLINRYWQYLHINQDLLLDYLPMLKNAGVGSFRFLEENLPIHEYPLTLEPIALNGVEWRNGVAYGDGRENPYLVFSLPEDTYVYGIRLKYSHSNANSTAPCRYLWWKGSGQDDFPAHQYLSWCPTGDRANWANGTWKKSKEIEPSTTAWIYDTIKEIKIYPDYRSNEWVQWYRPQPFTFKLFEMVLLVPDNTDSAETGRSTPLP